jgi:iron complex outermembrane receptor protein
MNKVIYLAIALLSFACIGFAEAVTDYHLGTIEVKGTFDTTTFYAAEEVYKDQAAMYEKNTIADALTLSPGVNITIGGRNEKNFTIRGFDQRQVPVYLDGIPISQAYDGYVDLGLFDTTMIDSIVIPKGHSSVLYGANTLGGSVNLLSVRPKDRLEGSVQGSFGSDSLFEGKFSLGTRQDRFYAMLVAGLIESDGFSLSDDYQSNAVEDGGLRDNSDQLKKTLYLKTGVTPANGSEFFIAYNRIEGEWGMPPRISDYPRYWRYTDWEKNTLYGVGDFQIQKIDIRTRLFYDQGRNILDSYDDDGYDSQTFGYAFHSTYEESSYGGSLTLSHAGLQKHLPSLALHYREDTHEQQGNYGSDWEKYSSETYSVGIEDQLQLTDEMTLLAGVGYDLVRPVYANGAPLDDDKDTFNFSAGINYDFDSSTKIHFLVSGKSRFPTLKELYSGYIDWSMPNPDLHEEKTINYEIGGEKILGDNLVVRTALFYSKIDDLIESVIAVYDPISGKPIYQVQNIDSAEYRGMELGMQAFISGGHELLLNYTYLDARNTSLDRTSDRLTDLPRHTLTFGDSWSLTDKFSISPLLKIEAQRYSRDGDDLIIKLPSYGILDITARYNFNPNLKIEAGVKNAFDRNYWLDVGLPREGRAVFAGLEAVF